MHVGEAGDGRLPGSVDVDFAELDDDDVVHGADEAGEAIGERDGAAEGAVG